MTETQPTKQSVVLIQQELSNTDVEDITSAIEAGLFAYQKGWLKGMLDAGYINEGAVEDISRRLGLRYAELEMREKMVFHGLMRTLVSQTIMAIDVRRAEKLAEQHEKKKTNGKQKT